MKSLKDESGQTLVLVAAFMGIVMLGFLALALDIGYVFQQKRLAQSAADAAVVAYVEEQSAGDSGNAQAAANAIAKLNGFDVSATTNPATVSIGAPTSGNYSGSGSYYQAIVSKPVPTLLLSAFLGKTKTMTVSGRAVAGGGLSSPSCVCLEGTTGQDLNMSNNAQISSSACGVVVNSSSSNAVGFVGSAGISSLSLATVSSTWDNSTNINNGGTLNNTKVILGISTSCSPATPAVPTYNSAECTADPLTHYGNGGSSYSVGPSSNASYTTTQSGNLACYTSLTVGANNDAVNINPGIYVINGGELHFESGSGGYSNTGGSGVTFFLTGNASLVIDNGANVNLTAPTSGTYDGIVIYQDPGGTPSTDTGDTEPISIQGGANTVFTGAIFAPLSNVTLGNGSGTTFTAEIVAKTLTMNGGGTLSSSAIANLGTFNQTVAKVAE
jgi:Flp pilus assembly protein TadG